MRLGVNIDHVATVREARKINYPDPVQAAVLVELAGAYGITVHLRQDRRHIKERDVQLLKETIKIHLNVEVSLSEEILSFICSVKPDACCLVPERVEEITTEGGLNIIKFMPQVKDAVSRLKSAGIKTTIFIEPEKEMIEKVKDTGADAIEINTGRYSENPTKEELKRVEEAAKFAKNLDIEVHAGHGLNYQNVIPIAKIKEIEELNIGHSIISRAIFVGLERAVREMLSLLV